jgi:tetratricopeptide (TPR) repeat protein
LKFVKKYYGQIEYGTALFKHANYLYENKLFDEAEQEYDKCIEIRKKNVYNGGLIDAIVNSAICLKELCQYDLAIQRIKTAIQITKDIFEDCPQIDDFHLFLAKLYF